MIPIIPEWINKEQLQSDIKRIAKGNVIVFCGTHDCAPVVIVDFINNVFEPNCMFEIDVPGDGEPSLYLCSNFFPNDKQIILEAYEAWYIEGFPGDENPAIDGLDPDNNYGLEYHIDTKYSIVFFTIIGDTQYED